MSKLEVPNIYRKYIKRDDIEYLLCYNVSLFFVHYKKSPHLTLSGDVYNRDIIVKYFNIFKRIMPYEYNISKNNALSKFEGSLD